MKDYDVIAVKIEHIENLIAKIRLDIKGMMVKNKADHTSVTSKIDRYQHKAK